MRPILLPEFTLKLPPLFCGEVGLYAMVHACGNSVVDTGRRFDKRFKSTHRFATADTRGRLELTVPVAKPPSSNCPWCEVGVSTHGAWWDVHRVALESAYGRTPYFEFYIDRFLPMLTVGVEERFPMITDLSAAWDREIRKILLFPDALAYSYDSEGKEPDDMARGEGSGFPTGNMMDVSTVNLDRIDMPAYYQVRACQLGFIPHLSILDLIFNLGPESTLYLDRLAGQAVKLIKGGTGR